MILIRESFETNDPQTVTDITKLTDDEILLGLATGSEEFLKEWRARTIREEQDEEE